jgi:Flp pilus assembly protein TadD
MNAEAKDVAAGSNARSAVFVVAVAVAVQVMQLWLLRDDPMVRGPIIDGLTYHLEAADIAVGAPVPPMPHWQAPLYPWLLSVVYRILDSHPRTGLVLQALLAVAISLLVFLIGLRMLTPRRATIAGILAAFYGPLLFFGGQLIPALLDASTALVVLWGALLLGPESSLLGHLALGIAGGTAAVARGTIAPFLLWLAVRPVASSDDGHGVWRSMLVLLGIGIGLCPVAISNGLRTGVYSPSSTNIGVNLWIGNNPDMPATTAIRPGWRWDLVLAEPARHGQIGPFAESKWFNHEAISWAVHAPAKFVQFMALKLADTFNGLEIPRNLDPYGSLGRTPLTEVMLWVHGLRFPFGLVLPLAAFGLILAWNARGVASSSARTLAVFTALNALGIAVFFPCGRYRLGMALALLPAAVLGADSIIRSARERERPPTVPLLVALAVGIFSNVVPQFTGPNLRNEGNWQLALAYDSLNDNAKLLSLCEEGTRREPNDAEWWRGVGRAKGRTGDLIGAEEAYRSALRVAPEYANVWSELGATLIRLGRHDEGRAALEKSVEIDPHHPTSWAYLSRMRGAAGDFAGALSAAEYAIRTNGAFGQAWLYLGLSRLALNRLNEAEAPLRRAAYLMPGDPEPITRLADLMFRQGRKQEAKTLQAAISRRYPNYAPAIALKNTIGG